MEKEKRFKEPDRRQLSLRPMDLDKLIPPDHPARAIWSFVNRLDMTKMEAKFKAVTGKPGQSPYSLRLLFSLWLYAYTDNVFSCRELERRCVEENAYMWLCGGLEPSYHTLSSFRSDNIEEFNAKFTEMLAILDGEGMIDLTNLFVDGSKVKANAGASSKHRPKSLKRRLAKAREALDRLDAMSEEERAALGRRKESARRRAAKEKMTRIEKSIAEFDKIRREGGLSEARAEEVRVSSTDPQSRKMKMNNGGFSEAYNVQAAVEGSNGVIVGVEVTQDGTDVGSLVPMADQVEKRMDEKPQNITGDSGYHSEQNLKELKDREIEMWCPSREQVGEERGKNANERFSASKFKYYEEGDFYECPCGKKLFYWKTDRSRGKRLRLYRCGQYAECGHKAQCSPKSKKGRRISKSEMSAELEEMRERMSGESGKAMRKKRCITSEWGFAQIKSRMGWSRFSLRGLRKVNGEGVMAAIAHNILRYAKWVENGKRPMYAT